MKAAVITELGKAPVYADFDEPSPQDGVVVTVAAASLKNIDKGLVSGRHYGSSSLALPSVAGVDGVARLDDGRLVYTGALAPFGMMAERALIDPNRAVPVPDGVDPAVAAALPNAGLSAWFALEYAGLVQPGQNVLILGATGVTGGVAIQLAKNVFGAGQVTAVGRNPSRLDWLRGAGADVVIPLGDDLREQIAAEHALRPIDVVIDYLWGDPAEQTLSVLGNSGMHAAYHATRYVQVGAMAGPTINLPAAILRSSGVQILGTGAGSVPAEAQRRVGSEILPRLFTMLSDGSLQLEVQRAQLSDVEQVWGAREPSGVRTVLVP